MKLAKQKKSFMGVKYNWEVWTQKNRRLFDFSRFYEITKNSAELLYDEFMMDYVLQLLSEMSASHVRPFRHTGTFCAMKLMSSLVGVALNVNKEIEDTTKQYDGELSKHGAERSQESG